MTAQQYIDDGWALVPLAHGTKAAVDSWNKTTYTAADITEGMAAKCGVPSGDRVCVDLDTSFAIEAARYLLPVTRLEGRLSKPDSHAWLFSPNAKSKKFKSLKRADGTQPMIVELLATNGYSVLPPTRHPSGEVRSWSNDLPLMTMDADDLQRAVRNIAITCLVAEHYPGPGGRHDARLALAGYLKRAGISPTEIREIGRAVEKLVKGDLHDWDGACSSTLGTSNPTTGGKTLADHLDRGTEVVRQLNKWLGKDRTVERTIQFTTADTIVPQSVRWCWDGLMPCGTFGLLAGREGLGKSLTTLDVAAQLTRGQLPGLHFGSPRAVIISATEDSWAHVIVPRLMAADADLTRIIRAEARTAEGLDDLLLPVDIAGLQAAVLERGDVAMLLLDPLLSRLEGKLDTHKDAEVRRALEPLVRLADQTDLVVLGLIHVNKGQAVDPLNSVMGSRAFTAVSRFVLFVAEDPNDDSIRLFGQTKNNLGPTIRETRTFEVETKDIPDPNGVAISAGRVKWTGTDPRSIKEIMQDKQDTPAPTAKGEAMRWLKQYLTQQGGYAKATDATDEGRRLGHHGKAIQRARRDLNCAVVSLGMPATKFWVLPGHQMPLGVTP